MPTTNTKLHSSGSGDTPSDDGDQGPAYNDNGPGTWQDSDKFALGPNNLPKVLTADGAAQATGDIGLQANHPGDFADISLTLASLLHLDAFARVAATGSVTSSANSQGAVTLTNGALSGNFNAALSIDLTASLPDAHAAIQMHITDDFTLALSGSGYQSASFATTAASSSNVATFAPPPVGSQHGSSGPGNGDSFDLVRFAAQVLDTLQWDIQFVATAPGESLKGVGSSIITIDAVATLQQGNKPDVQRFHDVDHPSISFSDSSSPGGHVPYGVVESTSPPMILSHTG